MIIAKQMQENFSRASAEYDAQADLQQELMERVLEAAQGLFPAGARLLDVGCGTGLFSGRAPQWKVMNLDLAPGMCERAQVRSTTMQADAMALPVANDSLDGVVSSLCLQWVSDKQAAFAEIARVLKPGAHAVLMTLAEGTLVELAGSKLQLLPMQPREAYEHWVQHAGLKCLRIENEPLKKPYSNLSALLNSMRIIGAGHAFTQHRGIGAHYYQGISEQFAKAHSNIATWRPLLMIVRKQAIA